MCTRGAHAMHFRREPSLLKGPHPYFSHYIWVSDSEEFIMKVVFTDSLKITIHLFV